MSCLHKKFIVKSHVTRKAKDDISPPEGYGLSLSIHCGDCDLEFHLEGRKPTEEIPMMPYIGIVVPQTGTTAVPQSNFLLT